MIYILLMIFGVTTSYWEERDFSNFRFYDAGISKDGNIALLGRVDSVFQTQDMYIWDILSTKDDVYFATGEEGKIYRIHKGKGELFFEPEDENVLCLAEDDGEIYAGTSPSGKIYKIDILGRGETILDIDEEFIWDLVVLPSGEVVCGTGGNGLVLKIKDKDVDTLLATGSINASRVVLIDKDIYVGTGDGGLLFMILESGSKRGLYDHGEGEVSGIVRLNNAIYFSLCLDTLSVIKRIRSDGLVEDVIEIKGIIKNLVNYKNTLFCISEGRIYRIYEDGRYDILYEFPTAISSINSSGFVGISKLASLYKLAKKPSGEGTVESYSYDTGGTSKWGKLTYKGKGKITFETMTGNTEIPDVTWEDWKGLKEGMITSSPNRFIRWKAKIKGNSQIESVKLAYLPLNQKPYLEFVDFELDSDILSFSAVDPDEDCLLFNICYREIGEGWIELEKDITDTEIVVEKYAFPDGFYQFKVEVSDSPSNPPYYALSSFKVSDVYRIDNTPPSIKIEVKGDRVFVDVSDDMSEIAFFDFSENASEFISIFPDDGIFDEKREDFKITIKPDTRHLVVRVRDCSGNVALKKWKR